MRCQHQLTRGPRRGNICNKKSINHYNYYCKNHIKLHTEMIIKSEENRCGLCMNGFVENDSKVILNCKCEYHLYCFKLIIHSMKCMKCDININDRSPLDNVFNMEDEEKIDYEECSICLDDIKEEIYITKCNHTFHNKCIIELKNNNINKCPCCRRKL